MNILSKRLLKLLSLFLLFIFGCNVSNSPTGSCINGNSILKTDTISTAGFNSINFATTGNVNLLQNQTNSVSINSDENLLPYILTSVSDSTLKIYSNISICPTKLEANLSMPNIRNISLSGSGNIKSSQNFIIYDFEISLSGSGNIGLNGTGHSGLYKIDGSGNINMDGMQTIVATAIVNGSGNIKVYATDRLTAVINGSGNIYYKGDPYVKNFTINGSGNIIKLP